MFLHLILFYNLVDTWSHPSTLWPALYLLCLHPVLWLSLSAYAWTMHTYLHLCMLKLLWILEWCGFTLVCCESLLLPILLFIFHRRKIFMHDILSFWCTKPLVEKNGISRLMIPTLWCRYYCTSLGFGLMHWKFFHIVIVLVWPKQVDFASNQQTEEKRFRNSILLYVWVNTWAIISKYELHFCVCVYESESACICICMYLILLKVCAKQISINCYVI